ncbi:MAG TPA: TMEM175 family protein [Gammaproteobacteria bacterium]|jgi:uncharacterized membrane protein|nr:TMEM175 family protein [Gammaproteobacteria bacterium]
MHKNRVEAFSDAVIAIVITIMVLEIRKPDSTNFSSLLPLTHIAFCYVLSFIYLAIYWNNHHHLFQAVKEVNGSVLWANILLLFWLTLVPFVTGWAGDTYFASVPTACYGFILFMAACSYFILTKALIAEEGKASFLAEALGSDNKTKLSIAAYVLGILLAFWLPKLSFAIYMFVAVMWFIPDSRIEKKLRS